jgi:hypothetical protein
MGAGGSREREHAYFERYVPGEMFCAIKESCVVHPASRLRDEVNRGVLWSVTHPPKKAVRDLRPYAPALADWSSTASVVGLRDLSTVQGRLKVIVRIDGGLLRVFAPEDTFHGGTEVVDLLLTQRHNVHVDWYRTDDLLREIFLNRGVRDDGRPG